MRAPARGSELLPVLVLILRSCGPNGHCASHVRLALFLSEVLLGSVPCPPRWLRSAPPPIHTLSLSLSLPAPAPRRPARPCGIGTWRAGTWAQTCRCRLAACSSRRGRREVHMTCVIAWEPQPRASSVVWNCVCGGSGLGTRGSGEAIGERQVRPSEQEGVRGGSRDCSLCWLPARPPARPHILPHPPRGRPAATLSPPSAAGTCPGAPAAGESSRRRARARFPRKYRR